MENSNDLALATLLPDYVRWKPCVEDYDPFLARHDQLVAAPPLRVLCAGILIGTGLCCIIYAVTQFLIPLR